MSRVVQIDAGEQPGLHPSDRLAVETGILAGRLAELLRQTFAPIEGVIADSVAFLDASFEAIALGRPLAALAGGALDRPPPGASHPLDRLAGGFGLSPFEVDLVLLAGLPEQHEGFADLLQTLNPHGQPYPTVALAAQLCGADRGERWSVRHLLELGPAVTAGVIRLTGEAPLFSRNLLLAEGLWSALNDIEAWPRRLDSEPSPISCTAGLEGWLDEPSVRRAGTAIVQAAACTILISDEDEQVALQRGVALAQHGGARLVQMRLPLVADAELERLLLVHALAHNVVPVIGLSYGNGPEVPAVPTFTGYPGPVVVAARAGAAVIRGRRPLIALSCRRLRPSELHKMWCHTLPRLRENARLLAARYPIEPAAAVAVAADLGEWERLEQRPAELDDVAQSVRTRAGAVLGGGVKLLRPTATWQHLVLEADATAQLREAINRLLLQGRVLDEWHFLEGRHGARGVRLLFAGPPGTGKTLSAEVLAHALAVDLLVVDLSRVVSKWIGETEKNLAEVFETAERARAVLLFDEADALFGKRTEVSDAHDRYANLETAYLLARLERFEGLAILATNLRQNIDPAFSRRLEFVITYTEPDRDQRLALWRCHLPEGAPLAADVDLNLLAGLYPITGGLIRNAAVAAAFLAAGEGSVITQAQLVRAIRREYTKTHKAFPGPPPGVV